MKQILLFIALPSMLLTTPSFARGHGGGHGGGHSHSHAATNHPSTANVNSAHAPANNAKAQKTKAIITRSTSPAVIAANHGRTLSGSPVARSVNTGANTIATPVPRTGEPAGTATATASTGYVAPAVYTTPVYYESYGNPYYSPYYYNPYFSMFSLGYGVMYSPSYYPVNSPNYANSANDDQIGRQPMDGFVVFYGDTLSGAVTVAKKAISMATTDSGKDYDYRFHEKDPGLSSVTVYNEDDKQLNLVRLKGDDKNLWRIIHVGKLNIYDRRRGFLYKPEDIDLKTLAIYYNGELLAINSSSINKNKEWLTMYVNQAYGLTLDPRDFSWKQLLIYVDKLD